MKKKLALGLVAVLALLGALTLDLAVAPDPEMAPSILEGDTVLIGPPGELRPGTVVVVDDPAEPGRKVLRRVIAVSGAEGRYDVRRREMFRGGDIAILNEVDRWLVQERTTARLEPSIRLDTPEGHVYLLADNRDLGLDSRWWGPVPLERIEGRVLLRWGSSDAWRGPVSIGAEDGPWIPPSKQ
ncbi:MAG TPA: signal peptidase I [Myxococcota bacterium]|nr:signal peptidase I [Myxococcota bacterium]